MRKSKGFTLVEIVITLFILSLIAMFMIRTLVANYEYLFATKKKAQQIYAAQQKLENGAQYTKDELKAANTNPSTGDGSVTSVGQIPMFGNSLQDGEVLVDSFQVKANVNEESMVPENTSKMYTLVGDRQQEQLPVPVISNLKIEVDPAPDYSDFGGLQMIDASIHYRLIGQEPDKDETEASIARIKYQWYITRPGFNMGLVESAAGHEVDLYPTPKFPQDYEALAGESTSNLLIDPSMAGKAVLLTAAPATKENRIGKMIVSNAVYIYGLPSVYGLKVHIDASLIQNSDDILVEGDADKVVRARDLSQSLNDATATDEQAPRLSVTKYNVEKVGDYEFDYTGQYIDFSGNPERSRLNISGDYLPQDPGQLGVYAVVKVPSGASNTFILRKGETEWIVDTAYFGGQVPYDEWCVIYMGGNGICSVNGRYIFDPAMPGDVIGTNDSAFIGYDPINDISSDIYLAELLVYDAPASPGEHDSVVSYLLHKYAIGLSAR